jgi:hypothetical protein
MSTGDLTLDYALGTGSKNYAFAKSLSDLYVSLGTSVESLNKKFNDGELSQAEYFTNVTKSRKELRQTLIDSGVSATEADKIYKEFGFDKESTAIKTLIDGKSPEEARKIIDGYIASFEGDKTLTFKAKVLFDLEAAKTEMVLS